MKEAMCYSVDLREKVVKYLEDGGSITQASEIFNIGRSTIYRWLNRPSLAATKVTSRQRKININELEQDVKANPDTPLKARAKKFGVSAAAISYRFKQMKITRKKNNYVIRKEIMKNGSIT